MCGCVIMFATCLPDPFSRGQALVGPYCFGLGGSESHHLSVHRSRLPAATCNDLSTQKQLISIRISYPPVMKTKKRTHAILSRPYTYNSVYMQCDLLVRCRPSRYSASGLSIADPDGFTNIDGLASIATTSLDKKEGILGGPICSQHAFFGLRSFYLSTLAVASVCNHCLQIK